MAKASNKKPGTVRQNSALKMKKQDNNILHSKLTIVIYILMILAFVGIPVASLLIWFI